MRILTFFNHGGKIGKTSLIYHTANMFAELGHRVLAVDLDPQTNLSQIFLDDDQLFEIIERQQTIKHALTEIEKKYGDILDAHVESIRPNLFLIPGDLELSLVEDKLSQEWYNCLTGEWYPFALESAFYRIIKRAAETHEVDYVFVDVGPNFGAINRATLISSDYLIVPSTADLFSLKGLSNIGERINTWSAEWAKRLEERKPETHTLKLPKAEVFALGYVLMQHGVNSNRPVKAYRKFADRIPNIFRESLKQADVPTDLSLDNDPYCLAQIKHYNSLMPFAMEARKPIFALKPADGAIGAHYQAVKRVYSEFETFAHRIVAEIQQQSQPIT